MPSLCSFRIMDSVKIQSGESMCAPKTWIHSIASSIWIEDRFSSMWYTCYPLLICLVLTFFNPDIQLSFVIQCRTGALHIHVLSFIGNLVFPAKSFNALISASFPYMLSMHFRFMLMSLPIVLLNPINIKIISHNQWRFAHSVVCCKCSAPSLYHISAASTCLLT